MAAHCDEVGGPELALCSQAHKTFQAEPMEAVHRDLDLLVADWQNTALSRIFTLC